MVAGKQKFPQFRIIVNLPVEDQSQSFIFVGHGLGAAGKVDNGEPPVAQYRSAEPGDSAVIGAAVLLALIHLLHDLCGVLRNGGSGHAGNGTHFNRTFLIQWIFSDYNIMEYPFCKSIAPCIEKDFCYISP